MCQVLPCRDDTVLKHLVNMFHFLTWSAVIFVCQTHLPLGYLLGYASIDNKTKRGYTAPFPNYRYSSSSLFTLSLYHVTVTLSVCNDFCHFLWAFLLLSIKLSSFYLFVARVPFYSSYISIFSDSCDIPKPCCVSSGQLHCP